MIKLFLFFIFSAIGAESRELGEDLTDLELDQFLEVFNLPKVDDPREKKKRAEILKRNQQKVLEANKAFQAGDHSWREEINELSHLSEEEFLASHTGLSLSLSLAPDNDTMSSLSSLHSEEQSAALNVQDQIRDFAVSFWQKGAYDRLFPCMEAIFIMP